MSNQVSTRVEKPSVILLDIEGTMTDISFVSKKLFPFIKANIETYFDECYARPETQELIKRMRESRRTLSEEESACCEKKKTQPFLFVYKQSSNLFLLSHNFQCPKSSHPRRLAVTSSRAWRSTAWPTCA